MNRGARHTAGPLRSAGGSAESSDIKSLLLVHLLLRAAARKARCFRLRAVHGGLCCSCFPRAVQRFTGNFRGPRGLMLCAVRYL